MAFYDFLNIVFAPLLKLPDVWSVLIISLMVSVLITLVTKYFTDQNLVKKLKEETKDLQKQLKEFKNNPQKLVELQKRQSELMIQQLRHSFKPTLITLVPLLVIFGWMSSVFSYESIKPNQEFNVYAVFDKNVNGQAELIATEGLAVIGDKKAEIKPGAIGGKSYNKMVAWTLKGEEGEHIIEIQINGEKQQHSVLITNEDKYLGPDKSFKGSIKLIHIDYKKNILLPIWIRDWLGWLGVYILSSLIFTVILRKILKVY